LLEYDFNMSLHYENRRKEDKKMKKFIVLIALVFLLGAGFGCASKQSVKSLEERVAKLEQQADVNAKKAEDAALRAEAAANKAEVDANKAEMAEQKSAKEFELMQKK
jgi:cell division protein FtsB